MWHEKNLQEIIKTTDSNIETGLSSITVNERLVKHGKNQIESSKKRTILKMLFDQINNILIYILIFAAIISALLNEPKEAIIILAVIILNSLIGIFQEFKAEKALESLKKLSSPKCIVKRDNQLKEINSENIVVGDIIMLDAGRVVPCDLRLIESTNLKIDESTLTGESIPSEKDANITYKESNIPIGDRKNMAFMSTFISSGRGYGIAISTSMDTEIGKIAKMLNQSNKELTPLQRKLNILGKNLGIITLIITFIIMFIGILQGKNLIEMFLTSISLAVAAIPEGMPAIITLVLSIGVQKMSEKNVIVRNLSSVESLGSVNIICSDKTGTLTLNKMTILKCFYNNSLCDKIDFEINNNTAKMLLNCMYLCNDSSISQNEAIGDPTEIALLEFYKDFCNSNTNFKRIDEIAFDSSRKLMTTVNNLHDIPTVFSKGAIDNLLNICNRVIIDGIVQDLTETHKQNIIKNMEKMADSALRIIGFAYKELTLIRKEEFEKDLIFIGMVGMIDPPRQEVKDAIEIAKDSNIKTIMITGDHKNTAFAIAKELNIASSLDETLSGQEIDKLSDEQLIHKIKNVSVFCRVSPEHKVLIVRALKSLSNIVSMTGDGINDAPSLKIADIGIAMGITGTDVAKNSADIILTDDNFKTIVYAVEEGRNIFKNIKKSILFLLTCNTGEILTIFTAIVLNFALPLNPSHILWVNLITDSLPALSLGIDARDENIMKEKPIPLNSRLFSKSNIINLILGGCIIALVTLLAFLIGNNKFNLIYGQTMAFLVLSFSQLILSLSFRNNNKSVFKIGLFKNKFLIYSIIIGISLQISLITIPLLRNFFNLVNLNYIDWLIVLILSPIPFIINELSKIFKSK